LSSRKKRGPNRLKKQGCNVFSEGIRVGKNGIPTGHRLGKGGTIGVPWIVPDVITCYRIWVYNEGGGNLHMEGPAS